MEGVIEIEHFFVVEQEENGKLNKFSKLEANKLVCHVFKWNKLDKKNYVFVLFLRMQEFFKKMRDDKQLQEIGDKAILLKMKI